MISFFEHFSDQLDCRFLTKTDDRTLVDPSVMLHQVHGNITVITTEPSDREHKADGVATSKTGLTLAVRAADCQNFAFFAPEYRVVGVLHAGWRGMLTNAIAGFFEAVSNEWQIDASDFFVAAGPSLCLKCAEYKDPEHELRKQVDPYYVSNSCIDLQMMANDQFIDAGVDPSAIERHPDCTRCNPDRYLTYRGGDRERVEGGESNVLLVTLK